MKLIMTLAAFCLFSLMVIPSHAAAGDTPLPPVPAAEAAAIDPLLAVAPIDVWPGFAPGETLSSLGRINPNRSGGVVRLTDVTRPQLHLYPASGPGPHPAVVVFPGGAYSILSINSEGSEAALWLNGLGFTVAVLEYRVPNKRDAAFQDGQRALSLLRARATEFGIDPAHLGVLGFSAGGHLAARLAAADAARSYPVVGDAADQASGRPDFAVLVYPAYLLDKVTHLSAPEVTPRAGMPPIFLTQTIDDPFLDAPEYAAGLQKVGVAFHCVIYDTGGHGYGLRLPATKPAHAWPVEAAAWLKQQMPLAK